MASFSNSKHIELSRSIHGPDVEYAHPGQVSGVVVAVVVGVEDSEVLGVEDSEVVADVVDDVVCVVVCVVVCDVDGVAVWVLVRVVVMLEDCVLGDVLADDVPLVVVVVVGLVVMVVVRVSVSVVEAELLADVVTDVVGVVVRSKHLAKLSGHNSPDSKGRQASVCRSGHAKRASRWGGWISVPCQAAEHAGGRQVVRYGCAVSRPMALTAAWAKGPNCATSTELERHGASLHPTWANTFILKLKVEAVTNVEPLARTRGARGTVGAPLWGGRLGGRATGGGRGCHRSRL